VGGLQLQIIPVFEEDTLHAGSAKNICPKTEDYKVDDRETGPASLMAPVWHIPDNARRFDVLATPDELGLKTGEFIHVKDLKSRQQPRKKLIRDLLEEAPLRLNSQDVVELSTVYDEVEEWQFIASLDDDSQAPVTLKVRLVVERRLDPF
jgi:hypothetical protein